MTRPARSMTETVAPDVATAGERRGGAPRDRVGRAVIALAGGSVLAVLAIVASSGVGLAAVVAAAAGLAVIAGRTIAALVRRLRRRRSGTPGSRRPASLAVVTVEVAALLIVGVAAFSWGRAMLMPSNSSLAIRTVEWMRDEGGAGLVSRVERAYYSLTAPSKGGAALRSLPSVGLWTPSVPRPLSGSVPAPAAGTSPATTGAARRARRRRARARAYRPPRIRPVIRPALAGEGVWRRTQGRFAHTTPPVLVTAYRPLPDYPRVVAGVAWFDHGRTRVSLYPGVREPPGGARAGAGQVPPDHRSGLLATFNSGFKHSDSGGGFFEHGKLTAPMVAGLGTIVGMNSGRIDVRAWHGGPRPGAGVAFARQNLPLIVDHGRPNPNLNDGPQWGATLGNAILVWRSGAGVDRHGNLLYAAAPYLGTAGLARILIHAGAVRAVELDINSYWVTLNTYGRTGARDARPLLPTMVRPPQRYLAPDDRDFFAVYGR